jgi:hypothetical protein
MALALVSLAWQLEPEPAWQQRPVFSRQVSLLVSLLVLLPVLLLAWQRRVLLPVSQRQVLRQWLVSLQPS